MDEMKKELAKKLLAANILLEADTDFDKLSSTDIDVLASHFIESKSGLSGLKIVTKSELAEEIDKINNENVNKAPMPIEVSRSSEFKPIASDIEAQYDISSNNTDERTSGSVDDFVSYFRSRLEKIKTIISSHRNYTFAPSIETLKSYTDGREVTIMGIVTARTVTKNGNVMLIAEDETGEAKIIFMNSQSREGKELFAESGKIIKDEVIAVKGKISGPFIIAKEIVWPGVPIKERKKIEDDIAIGFISDIHIGSKLFMEKNFTYMLKWLNGKVDSKSKALAGKIKYIIMAGDVVDGIGVYPGQENDLAVLDVYKQYKILANFLESIPDYIHVFIIPGNHDAVQRAEPQPELPYALMESKQSNVHLLPNPSWIVTHGISTLAYHGTSMDSMIDAIPNLSYSRPEEVMTELLKRRHLSPIYGGNVIVPSRNDSLVINNVPDILNMGHVHKTGIAEYHGVHIINSGSWQDRTSFQVKHGLIPEPCVLPVFEAKSYALTSVDFRNL